jgi:hypothetical protein
MSYFELNGLDNIVFPISRERLANIRVECNELQIETYIKTSVENMSLRIIKDAYIGRTSTVLYLYGKLAENNAVRSILSPYVSADAQTPEILRRLQQRFPDCTFSMDNYKTYISVSW